MLKVCGPHSAPSLSGRWILVCFSLTLPCASRGAFSMQLIWCKICSPMSNIISIHDHCCRIYLIKKIDKNSVKWGQSSWIRTLVSLHYTVECRHNGTSQNHQLLVGRIWWKIRTLDETIKNIFDPLKKFSRDKIPTNCKLDRYLAHHGSESEVDEPIRTAHAHFLGVQCTNIVFKWAPSL